ncbi:fimbria/pilus outer membrane usher protein [Variovorax boronicumulans]|uniref:fimbria/pilus outer membrane usher protein n=1 Tax=Variovorax boronicumulans TaxID=436515 RepID=UPI0035A8E981
MHHFSAFHAPFRWTVCVVLLGVLGARVQAQPQAPQQQMVASNFNEEFLGIGGDQPRADLSLFSFGNRVLAGNYMVDVSLNERGVGQAAIRFVDQGDRSDATPCLARRMLDDWGVNVAVFPALANSADDACVDLTKAIPDASFNYDGGKQRLSVSIPQAALKRSARGAVGPEKWDKGITAGMLDYQLSFGRSSGGDTRAFSAPQSAFDGHPFADPEQATRRSTMFAGVRAGFNYGDWRFRHFSTYNRGTEGRGRWEAINTYAQRDIASIHGQLLIGDGSTPGNFFDSVPFRGVQLASDDTMLPDSQQGYAPTIRGVAQTNARVTVRQNGYVVYSTFVAPGAFVIDDLYPTASNGDLEVSITEADGRQTKYIQAFSAVPTLLREGTWRYSATVGKYRRGYGVFTNGTRLLMSEPTFIQATLARGLGREFTLYGGLTAANMYQSLLAGVGKNLRDFGAVSADLSTAYTTAPSGLDGGKRYSGQSVRFLYAKSFLDSGTDFRVAGYRYSTSGYRTFQEAVQMQDLQPFDTFNSRRNELRFELSQRLGDKGAVFASARQQTYWGTDAKDRVVQMGYSGSYKQFGYSVFYNQTRALNRPPVRQLMVMLSIPLGSTGANAQYTATRDNNGSLSQQVGVYGSAFDDNRLSYSVTATDTNQGGGGSGSGSASYLSQIGRFDIGHSQSRGIGQSNFGVAGGALFHAGGITLSQPLGETIGLVQAPKAQGVGLEAQPGVATDGAGQAVIPNLTPYRRNRLALRTADLGDTMEVKNAVTEVVPTRGAVVIAKFETSVGYRLLMTLTDRRGGMLPLGSKIENETGQEVGVVGPESQAFVTGAGASGNLTVRWGQGPADQCVVPYSLADEKNPPPIRELKGQCAAAAPHPIPTKEAQ